MTADPGGSFLDWLLAGDRTGKLQQIVDEHAADLAAGDTWGVFDGDTLVDTQPARFLAESSLRDAADATDRDPTEFHLERIAP